MLYFVQVLKIVLYIVMGGLALFALYAIGKYLFRAILKLPSHRQDEFLRIFLILLGALILLSLITFNKSDIAKLSLDIPIGFDVPDLERPSLAIANRAGIVGVIVSFWLFTVFGISAYLIPVLLFAWGIAKVSYRRALFLKTWFVIGVMVLISLLASLPILGLEKLYVGLIGEHLRSFLAKYVSDLGTYLVIFVFFIALLFSLESFRRLIFRPRRVEKKAPEPFTYTQTASTPRTVSPVRPTKKERLPIRERPLITQKPPIEDVYLTLIREPPAFKGEPEENRAQILERRFEEFGVTGKVVDVSRGPVVTRYEYKPDPGIKLSKIAGLSDDLALSMKSERVRIVAPIPGKSTIGIEVPNRKRQDVYLKEIITSSSFASSTSKLTVALGKDIAGNPIAADITSFPHLLISGATGSGKSVCINAIIASILYRALPTDVRFVMIDPKGIELPVYNGIPHLTRPTITRAKEALQTLKYVTEWMEIRYREFARAGVRDIEGYNIKGNKKPYIVMIIDELADLMLTAPRDIEESLTRLAQMSRAVGIHLILATQRPSVDVITGLIKANFPARIAFQVASKTDSRTILDMNGAEKLLGRGDMLFIPPGKGSPERLHGAYISTKESRKIADLWAERHLSEILIGEVDKPEELAQMIVEADLIDPIIFKESLPGSKERISNFMYRLEDMDLGTSKQKLAEILWELDYHPPLDEEISTHFAEQKLTLREVTELDELFNEAKTLVIRHQVASVSLLQRHFKIGYARAGRIIDQLEHAGIVGPYVGSKSREVLIPREGEK